MASQQIEILADSVICNHISGDYSKIFPILLRTNPELLEPLKKKIRRRKIN